MNNAYWDMVSELPPELTNEEDYLRMCADENLEYICESNGWNIACQRCTEQGDLGNNCWRCPIRPFGTIPCRQDLHCWNETCGVCGDGEYCDLILVCDLIEKVEGPFADLARRLFGD